jgi:sec-independent protein translocase protein TatB
MLDFDASKLLIIGVVALVVIGPKDLPRVLRQVGQMVGKLRRMAGEFQGQFMDAMKEADLQDLRNEVAKLKDTASLDVAFDPVHDIRTELTKAVEAKPASHDLPPATGEIERPGSDAKAALADAPARAALPDMLGDLALAEPAHHTVAASAGAVDAVSAPGPGAPDHVRRRKIVVPKRRAPGDRLTPAGGGATGAGRTRAYLAPRRDPRP